MDVELIDPLAAPIPGEWERSRVAWGLPANMSEVALSAVAWSARRPVRLAIVEERGEVAALFVGEIVSRRRAPARYQQPGEPLPIGIFSCRLLVGFSPGFQFAPNTDGHDRRRAVRAFESTLRDEMGHRLGGFVYQRVADTAPFDGRSVATIPTAPMSVIENRWSSIDEYFDALPGRRRHRLRAAYRDIRADGSLERLWGERIDAVAASDLDLFTRSKYADRRRLAPLSPTYLRRIGAMDGARFFGYTDTTTKRLLAFVLAFTYRRRLMTTVVGTLDPRRGGRRELYFDLYLQEIEWAIAHGLSHIELGPGMADLKARFGATPVPARAVLAAR